MSLRVIIIQSSKKILLQKNESISFTKIQNNFENIEFKKKINEYFF